MTAAQTHITPTTPMGATLVDGGATFRVWAPGAVAVHVALDDAAANFVPSADTELRKDPASGHWTGFFPDVVDGTRYRFYVVGTGAAGLKRDPWARELQGSYPNYDCVVRDPGSYPWHDAGFRPPAFSDLVVYQFHIGVFSARDDRGNDLRPYRVARFLDAIDRVEYLADLGVNAIQPLPVVEFHGPWSVGYNGTDIFSPEMDYCVAPADLGPYLDRVNALLAAKGCRPLTAAQLAGQVNQLKAFVDVFHLYGIAVIVDVVYNHAGGDLDAQSIDYFDLPSSPGAENNLYFGAAGWAGGRVFKFSKPGVCSLLTDNARMFLEEYHADGLRFDEVRVIQWNGGRPFCEQLTDTLRWRKPEAVLIAEYWEEPRGTAVWRPPAGLGFDLEYADQLRGRVRAVVAQASGGAAAAVDVGLLRGALERPWGVPSAWQAYNYVENHDLQLADGGDGHRQPRVPRLADPLNPRSWYARSRSRAATGLLLTAPGVPALFMGQEFLEDKLWSDSPQRSDLMIWWDGVEGDDPDMVDFHRFTRDLLHLRRALLALRSEPVDVFHVNQAARVLAFHRWVPGEGRDVVVVLSLNESTFYDGSYRLGFPLPGYWRERHNSDVYDRFPNPWTQGNFGGVTADGPPLHGFDHSAGVTIPANGLLVFARD
jgi:1,4-alpha-glucan branching enzyme